VDSPKITAQNQRARWLTALRDAQLDAYVDALQPLMRSAIAVVPREVTAKDRGVGASRIGGTPDLPAGLPWPADGEGSLPFVAQLDLEALAPFDVERMLPHDGLLLFFCGWGQDGDRGAVLHVKKSDLEPRVAPDDVETERAFGIGFEMRVELPPWSSPLVAIEKLQASIVSMAVADHIRYAKLYAGAQAEWEDRWHGLLGHTRAMEDAVRPDEVLLLRLFDDGTIEHPFNEAAVLYFVIDREALARGDFGAARAMYASTI